MELSSEAFWPDEEGAAFKLKPILEPLAPFQDRLLTLHGICDKIRGDGDNHMRGMGCMLTGIELFPGNIQGGSDTPAGWASGLSIDQEIKNFLQSKAETKTRFGSLEFGVVVPELGKRRREVVRVFSRVLRPGFNLPTRSTGFYQAMRRIHLRPHSIGTSTCQAVRSLSQTYHSRVK